MANKRRRWPTMTVAKLGAEQGRRRPALGANNVEYTWKLDDTRAWRRRKTYAQHMLELKQIRALPDFATFLNPQLLERDRQSQA